MYVHETQHKASDAHPAAFAHILCAVDGSRGSDVAVEQALALAGPAGVTFIAVTDLHGSGAMQMATLGLRRGQDALARAAAAARHAGVEATTVLRRADDVRDALLEQAGSYDLLVLGTHGAGRRAGVLLGDVATTALHRAPVPTLVARPEPHGTVFPADMLVASDGTAASYDAVEVAAAIALRHGARVTLLHAGAETPELRHDLAAQQTRLVERTGAEPAIVEVDGHAPEAIVGTARELPASLIVTGSRMLTGVRALRSVSERVGHMAPCSVLVVRS